MLPENRGRPQRADFQLQSIPDGFGFPPIRHHAENVSSFENLLNGHGYCPLRHVVETFEPPFAYLLAAARLVEFHKEIWFLRFEIGWWVVEREMSVLPNAHERNINSFPRNQLSNALAFVAGIRTVAIQEVESSRPNAIDNSLL